MAPAKRVQIFVEYFYIYMFTIYTVIIKDKAIGLFVVWHPGEVKSEEHVFYTCISGRTLNRYLYLLHREFLYAVYKY